MRTVTCAEVSLGHDGQAFALTSTEWRSLQRDGSASILLSWTAMSIEPTHMLELNLPAVSRVARLREILVRNVRTQFTDYLRVFAGTGMREPVTTIS